MKTKHLLLFVCLYGVIVISTSGCSTLTTGNSQPVTINTEPAGATCTLSRKGVAIAMVNPTPGSVTVDKSMNDISVVCKKDGYQEGTGVFDSKFQGMVLGNILFGGLIGLAIDAGSGAMHRYQSMLTISMIPAEFNSTAECDAFFDKMKADCITDISKKIDQVAAVCGDVASDENKKSACEMQRKALEEEKEKRLSEIEQKRAVAQIRS
jgi:hypothetical protein